MPRNMKCRLVCSEPPKKAFFPEGDKSDFLILNVEELEALRLCDLENLDQDRAAERMNVSRGTFQRILYAARKTTAQALVSGSGLMIGGGHYQIASKKGACGQLCSYCRFDSPENQDKKDE